MATYTIQIAGGQLSDERKAALPEAVKDAHGRMRAWRSIRASSLGMAGS
jgi:hypothetical protein